METDPVANELIKTVLLTLLGMSPGFLALWLGRRKTRAEAEREEADASDRITKSALSLVEPLKRRIADMDAEITALRADMKKQNARVDELNLGIYKLIRQIEALGQEPVWRPKKISGFDDDTIPAKR